MSGVVDRQSDAQLLDMLDLAAHGKSRADIADLFGLGRNQVIGLLFRIRRDADMAEAAPPPAGQSPAVRPENRDGGMAARWWVAGLCKQTNQRQNLRTRRGVR